MNWHKYLCNVVNITPKWCRYLHTHSSENPVWAWGIIGRITLLTAWVRHSLWCSHGFCTFHGTAWAEKETDGKSYWVQLLIFQLWNGCHLFNPCPWCPQCQHYQQHCKLPLSFMQKVAPSAQVNPAWGQLSSQRPAGQASYLILVRSCSAQQKIAINKAGLLLTLLDNDTLDQSCFHL